jgi:hypothetical protein
MMLLRDTSELSYRHAAIGKLGLLTRRKMFNSEVRLALSLPGTNSVQFSELANYLETVNREISAAPVIE